MYLHIGGDVILRTDSIVAVCDMDNTTGSYITREFLAKAEKAGEISAATNDLPKSFIVCAEDGGQRVCLSQLAPATLAKREQRN